MAKTTPATRLYAACAMAACLVSVLFLPLVAFAVAWTRVFPAQLENILFFFPQFVFCWYGFLAWDHHGFFEYGGCGLLSICQWAGLSFLFARTMEGRSRRFVLPAALVLIGVVTVVSHLLIPLVGLSFRIDAP